MKNEIEIEVKERIPFPTSLLSFPSKSAFMVIASGNNMSPTIKNGSRLICEKKSFPINGSIVVAKYKGQLECKFYRNLGVNEWLEDSNMKTIDSGFIIIGVVRQILSHL